MYSLFINIYIISLNSILNSILNLNKYNHINIKGMSDAIGLFIFRKDLRLTDNLGLIKLSHHCKYIIPIFILDNNQIDINEYNQFYRSNNAIQFMLESIIDLNQQLKNKLNIFKGEPKIILDYLIQNLLKLDKKCILKVGFNLDYTKYALLRDKSIIKLCKKHKIDVITEENDITLIKIEDLLKSNKEPYMMYSSFYKNAILSNVNKPKEFSFTKFIKLQKIKKYIYNISDFNKLYNYNNNIIYHGGRSIILSQLNHKEDVYIKYTKYRNLLNFKTFLMSAYLNFGCISIREIYHTIMNNKNISKIIKNELTKQLFWRDYFTCILRYTPNANNYNHFIDPRFDKIKWPNEKKLWVPLMESRTGFLIIDAGMNELKTTGYINNRMRLLLATFWIKYLLINPLHLKYGAISGFSLFLIDCNTSQNKLNHQWFLDLDISGRRYHKKNCHSLSGRFMRIDNEIIKKVDSNCEYIKKWLPVFKNIPNKDIYKWNQDLYIQYNIHYPPMFDWEKQYSEYCKLFKNI
jgi:deoxyribodipyrimidine photo-lyase